MTIQIAALLLAVAGIAWGLFTAYGAAFPGPSGEWAVIVVFASYVFNISAGLITLAAGLAVRRGSPRLRRLRQGAIGAETGEIRQLHRLL